MYNQGGDANLVTADVLTESGWESNGTPLPAGTYAACMAYFDEDSYIISGGIHTVGVSPQTFIFSPTTSTWIQGPNLGTARFSHGCGRLPTSDGSGQMSVVVAGGFTLG